jgi:hypothetical protein
MSAAYSWHPEIYVGQSTKLAEELPRTPLKAKLAEFPFYEVG